MSQECTRKVNISNRDILCRKFGEAVTQICKHSHVSLCLGSEVTKIFLNDDLNKDFYTR